MLVVGSSHYICLVLECVTLFSLLSKDLIFHAWCLLSREDEILFDRVDCHVNCFLNVDSFLQIAHSFFGKLRYET